MKVYVGQYGSIWSLSAKEWMELCEEASDTGTYDLTSYKKLTKRPRSIINWRDDDGSEFGAADEKTIYREPLDWTADEFLEELRDFPVEAQRVRRITR
jgi:type II restriction/modification system DNA methylase subunit YeeA